MKEWRDQAEKNSLIIIDHGRCQLCGSKTKNGLTECIEKSSLITHNLSHADGIKSMTIFLCVDAHALQHPEIHGKWNNHFHLTRLNLILNEKIKWDYKLSPILSRVLDSYKTKHWGEIIEIPEKLKRGAMTITDVETADSDNEYIKLMNQWAEGVFESYHQGHAISSRVSELFKQRISGSNLI